MLLEAPLLLREPLVYPPPPPLAFAKETAGAPMSEHTMAAARNVVVVFKIRSFL